jgi:hypothetical protein
MLRDNLHISDEELLLMTDGELSTRRSAQVGAHLAACWSCRSRMAEMEGTILDFAQAYRAVPVAEPAPMAGPRALLSARMAALAAKSSAGSWSWFKKSSGVARVAAMGVALISAALFGRFAVHHALSHGTAPVLSFDERGAVPNRRLTPGATRTASIHDLCSAAHEEVVGQVTAPLRDEVLREYGIAPSRAREYEIDYLIAPGLGGTEDIHNLWPQSYTEQNWNAYAKDSLEERLHELVCAGTLDQSSAQRDIANDWIAAYKKYFRTDRPLPFDATLDPLGDRGIAMAALGEP